MANKIFHLDIKSVIEDNIWKRFTRQRTIANFFKRRRDYYFDINWATVQFSHKTIKCTPRPSFHATLPEEADMSTQDNKNKAEGKQENDPRKEVDLYGTVYENTTSTSQQYTFTTEKQTKKTINVELSKSYTKGETTNINIETPAGIPSLSFGTSRQLTIEKKKGESFEETMTWNANTQIPVNKNRRITATLEVSEEIKIFDFIVETTLQLVKDKDLCVAVHKQSNGEMVHVFSVADLETIFKPIQATSGGIIARFETDPQDSGRSNVVLVTHGSCRSVSYKNQHIRVQEEIIDAKLED